LVVLGTMGHRLGVVTPWGTILRRESEPEQYFPVAGPTGEWISLTVGGISRVQDMSASEVCVFPHDAAEAMGAAKVDIQ
jgi:hypothetical protein